MIPSLSLFFKTKDAWLKQLESFSMFLQEFLLRRFLLLIKKMLRLEVFSKLVSCILPSQRNQKEKKVQKIHIQQKITRLTPSPPSKPGAAFALGIAFAIITCASTSGGHFNPAITICFAIWQGFPWRKVPYYIFSQILGAFIAGILMMGMYHQQLSEFETSLKEAGHSGSMVFNGGPASVLCSIPNGNQTNLGYLFFIEFFVDAYIVSCFFLPSFPFPPLHLLYSHFHPTGHNNLGSPRPREPLHLRLLSTLRNRPRLRNNDMGLGTGHNLDKSRTRFRHKNRGSNVLRGRSFFFS